MFNSEEYLSNIAIPNFADPELTAVAKEMTDAVKTPDANEFAKVAMQTISPMGIGENIQSDFPLQTEGQKADSQRSNQQFNADTPVGLSQMQLRIAQDDLINAEMQRRAQDKYNAWRQAKINQAKIVNTVNQQNNFNDSLIPSNQLLQNLKDSSKSDLKPTIDFTLPIQDFQSRTATPLNFLPSDEFKKSLENNLLQKSDNTPVNVKNPFLPGESKQIKLDVLTHGLLNSLTSVVDPILKKFNLSVSNIPVISTGNATNDKIFGGIGEIIGALPSLIGAGGVASSLAKNIASPLLKTIITGGGTFALAGAPNNFLSLATGEQTWGKTAERLGSDLLFGAAFSKLPKGTTAKDVLGLLGAATLGYTQSAVSNRDFRLTEDNLVNAGIITLLHGFGLSKDGKVDPKVEKVITEVKDKVEKPEELKNSINELKKITIEDNGNEIQKEKGLQEINAADTNIPEKTSIPMQENVVKQEIPAEDLTKKVQNGQPLTDQEIDTVINNNIDVSKPVVETPKSPDNGNLVGIDKAYNLKKMDEWGVEPPESSLPGDKQLFETVKNNFAEGKYDDKYINDTIANADKGWSAEQNNVMKIVRKENDFEYRRLYKEQQKAIESGDEAAYNELKKQADYCLAGDRKIGDAATLSNKVNSQNLRSIGGRIDDDYNVVRVIREATDLNSGVELSPEKHQQFVEAVEKYETAKLELKTKNDEIEKLRNDLELQKNINRINSEVKSENAKREYSARSGERANKVATVKEKRTALLDDLTKLYVSQSSQLNAKIIPFGDIQSMNILRKLAGTYIEEGVIKAADVLDKMYTDLKAKFPDGVFTKEDISRAITGYGREVQKEIESKTNRMQDLKKVLILNSKIEDLKNGNKPYVRKKGMMKTANEEITRLQNEYKILDEKNKISEKSTQQEKKKNELEKLKNTPEYKLQTEKNRLKSNIAKIQKDIVNLQKGIEVKVRVGANVDEEILLLRRQKQNLLDTKRGVVLQKEIEKAKKGVIEPKSNTVKVNSEKVQQLEQELKNIKQKQREALQQTEKYKLRVLKNNLKNDINKLENDINGKGVKKVGANNTIKDDAESLRLKHQKQKLVDKKQQMALIEKIEKAKKNELANRKKGQNIDSPEVKALKQQLNDIIKKQREDYQSSDQYKLDQAKKYAQKEIEKLDQDIKTLKQGQIPEKPTKKNVNDLRADQTLKKQREEVARKKLEIQGMLEDIKRQNELTIREQFKESPLRTIWGVAKHIPGVTKSLKATLDFSMLLRQGVRTLLTNPDIWAKNALKVFSDTMGTIKGKDVIKEVNIEIMSRENFPKMVEDKLAVGVTEEAYPDSEILTKIPIFGKLHKVSEVTYEAFMRRIRADLYDKYTTALEKSGIEETTGRGLGKLVNSLTGRGNLGRLEAVGDVVNVVAFAPRLVKSHLDVFSAHTFDKNMSPVVKKIAVKNLLKIMAGMATVGAIANIIRPGSAETDPRSKNFGKIKVGNTTFDYTGGMASLLVLGSQIASQSTKSPLNDRIRKLGGASFGSQTGMDVLVNYMRGKASPITSFGIDLINQKDFLGKPITVQGELVNLFAPLPANTAYELLTTPDAANFYVGMLADMLGVSTNTYTANDQFGMSKEITSIKSEQENLAELKQKVIDTKNITDKRNLRDEYNKRYRELERQKYKSKEYQEYLKAQEKKKLEKNKQFNN